MKKLIRLTFASAMVLGVVALTSSAFADNGGEKEPLKLNLPEATLKGTPEDLPTNSPNTELPPTKATSIMIPKGAKNVALGKPVTSSVAPFSGDLNQITDGKKEPVDSDAVELKRGVQWVQVDLGQDYDIYAIALWHDHRYLQVMKGVIVQVSDDPEFKTGVTTVFNNDRENVDKLGAGKDREYFETRYGKVIDAHGVKARYVRGYTRGSNQGAMNAWQEIEVYALPAK